MTRVVKVGGRPQSDPALIAALASAHGETPGALVVVHGGGDEVSALQKLHGAEAKFSGGRRITSTLDLEIVRMALSGSANKRLVAALVSAGAAAVGLSGEDAALVVARALDVERFGFAGTPARVQSALLEHLLRGGYLPVISPVSRGDTGSGSVVLNVNGDDAASAIAVALGAEELLLVSDVAGVLVDREPVSLLGPEEARRLIDDGIAVGGMSAKLEAALAALEGGVERVRISDIAAIEDLGRGTVLTRVGSVCA
jgi:acetylglutamate kinase